MALITTAEAYAMIPGLASGSSDTLVGDLIDRAGDALAAWCGFSAASAGGAPSLESTTYTEYLDGPEHGNARAVKLSFRPVASITTIHDDSDWGYGAAYLVSSSDYVLDGQAGRVWLTPSAAHTWSEGARNIKVVYVAGFSTVPDDVKQACALTVAHWVTLPKRQGRTGASGPNAGGSYGPETLPASAKELVSHLKLGRAVL